VVVSVSTAFYSGAHNVTCDTIFSSSDSILFYFNSLVILAVSPVAFEPTLSAPLSHPKHRNRIIHFPETSDVLNIILHVLYGISPANYVPSLGTLVTAVTQMPRYGIIPKAHNIPINPVHALLLSFAPRYPIDIYTLAGQFDLRDLAVLTSTYLLSYPLNSISDEMAARMGPIYFKDLVTLFLGRLEALKSILFLPPCPHPPSQECCLDDQKRLTNAWVLVSGYLAWDAKPGRWKMMCVRSIFTCFFIFRPDGARHTSCI
jgi:hypothetical protein